MVYKASLDKLAIGITISTVILFLALPVFYVTSCVDKSLLVILMLVGFVLIAGWAYHPTSYSISGTHVVIHRPIRNLLIEKDKIQSAFKVPQEDISYSIRLFGAGGFFGYFGKFANRKLGTMTWYASRRDNAVLINANGKKLIVTPDSPEDFVNELKISERN